jgi:hypothetical protein
MVGWESGALCEGKFLLMPRTDGWSSSPWLVIVLWAIHEGDLVDFVFVRMINILSAKQIVCEEPKGCGYLRLQQSTYVYVYSSLHTFTFTAVYRRLRLQQSTYVYVYSSLHTFTFTAVYIRLRLQQSTYVYVYSSLQTFTFTAVYRRNNPQPLQTNPLFFCQAFRICSCVGFPFKLLQPLLLYWSVNYHFEA